MDDVIVMLGLGVLTYGGMKLGFPVAPAVLGIILGPIAEENFLRGKLIAETDVGMFSFFCTGEINLVLIAIAAFSVVWGVWVEYSNYKRTKAGKEAHA
jgi:putative tricarboxylic transport membrane protein